MDITDYSFFRYGVPSKWYSGVYRDKKQCCKAARPFYLKHDSASEECWLLIHGFRGYPGELVRPAVDLFNAGFDVYVPRLPGCGTCLDDFIRTTEKDWLRVSQNALNDLKKRYKKVNLLGHSMGCVVNAIIGSNEAGVGKIVHVSPSFECSLLSPVNRLLLNLVSPFKKALKCQWQPDNRYHLHYENAPCDDLYLGHEYFQYNCPRQTLGFWRLGKKAEKYLVDGKHEVLTIYPLTDKIFSEPSIKAMKKHFGDKANIVEIPGGTHFVFYDIDPNAEEKAVMAVLEFAK